MIFFNNIIKRVANFSIQSYDLNKHDLPDFFENNELFNLCLLTASGSLYNALSKNRTQKTEASLSNYFLRAHFNPTPFGVFNSVGTLQWDTETNIIKNDSLRFLVKYDNFFISSKLNEGPSDNWKHLNYCVNPSVYFMDKEKLNFYKSKNQADDKIELNYTELDVDEDLQWLLDQFKYPKKMDLVIKDLISQGFDTEEVETFLLEIIETGLIIEFFLYESYAGKLNSPYAAYLSGLVQKKEHLIETKEELTNFIKTYIKEQDDFFEENDRPKNFYAINSFETEGGSLNFEIQSKIQKYIDFTVNYNSQTTIINDNLNKFNAKLSEKYNDGFIPLNDIFNPYSGINYRALKEEKELKLHQDILLKIIASDNSELFLNLPVSDNIDIKASKLPVTFNVILETLICKKSGESIIYVLGMGDPSALNLISRFSDITKDACEDIVNYEKEIHKSKIVADIKCVGSFRSINVAPVEQRYDYCIPINASYTEAGNPILLSDLFIHLHGKNISLISKQHQKEVLPKKGSAINQMLFDSDAYNFLCDYEFYNKEIYGVNFNFNLYRNFIPYVPRLYLEEGILLQPAQILLIDTNFDLSGFSAYLLKKRIEYSFAKKITILDKRRLVVLDLDSQDNISYLLEKLKTDKFFYISECLYESFDPSISRGNENFAHELVVSVKNSHYLRPHNNYDAVHINKVTSQNAAVVSHWLYLEVFCNVHSDPEIFKIIQNEIIAENKTDQFFFVNYNNPDRHLRLRFKTKSIENKQFIINIIHKLKSKNVISKYHILPYEQELYRYGGLEMMEFSEDVFNLDSRDLLQHILDNDLEEKTVEITAILKIKNYLAFLNFSIDDMIQNCEDVIKNYSQEFELTGELRKEFNKDFAVMKFEIEKYDYGNFLDNDSLKNKFSKNISKVPDMASYAWLLIHMSMNRHFKQKQRFNEFKMYYLTKSYLNHLKYKK